MKSYFCSAKTGD